MHQDQLIQRIVKATGLDIDQVQRLLDLGHLNKVPRKSLLLSPGQKATKGYFLLSGVIRHYTHEGQEQFTKNLIRGPRFMLPSLTSFFMDSPAQIHCEALTDLHVIEWSREVLLGFADDHLKMYKFLLKAVVRAFHGKEKKEIAFVTMDAQQRYLKFLDDFPNLANEIPIQYVASYLGIRPETLSRIRAKLIS